MTHIYYYSWSGKTRYCAEAAARMLSCGITEIVEIIPRKKSIFGFLKSGYEASRQKSSEIRKLPMVEGDTVILAFPVWAGKIPPAVNTALRILDFKNRRVVVINTMGGESKSAPVYDMTRTAIMQGGADKVDFIQIATGRYSEENWENTLRKELTGLMLVE